jgi:histidinol-phosphate aminotransferase
VAPEFAARVARLPDYPVAGGYALPDDVALLASNESPWGPLPEVVEAAARAVRRANRYPDPSYWDLRRALGERYGVAPNRIAVGNGSVDLLLAAGEALLEPGAEIVYAWPSFSVYPHLPAASGATAVEVALDDAQRHDLEAMLEQVTVATRLVLVCNPNNPSSTALPLAEIAAFVARVPAHATVVLDEAYCEFSLLDDPDASIELLEHHPNLILLRTFSKVYGLAALRVGFALCASEAYVRALHQVRQPFLCNAAASAAAIEALRHQDAVAERVERTIAARIEVQDGLDALGIAYYASQANFAWLDLPDGIEEADVVAGLAERGVLVRAGAALGRPGALRVTYGTSAENGRFLAALGELVRAPAVS